MELRKITDEDDVSRGISSCCKAQYCNSGIQGTPNGDDTDWLGSFVFMLLDGGPSEDSYTHLLKTNAKPLLLL
jgi:hypothetical protein